MKVSKDQGYFAAFNTPLRATDGEKPPAFEYQRPATRIYHDFLLFLRRYPKDKSHFVDDVALGRPVIIVEHHGAFRNGYKAITDLVDWINNLGNINWISLLNIAEHYLGKKATFTGQMINSSPLQLQLNLKTILRRFLSETRDNYVETSNFLTKVYKAVRG